MNLCLFQHESEHKQVLLEQILTAEHLHQVQVGRHAFINLITLPMEQPLPIDTLIYYDLDFLSAENDVEFSLSKDMPTLCYKQESAPSFAIKPNISQLYHGSCRKPHFAGGDGLVQVDEQIAGEQFSASQRASLLMMSGDQVYVDDVAGPTLSAIHQVIKLLGLFDEQWKNEVPGGLTTSQQLYQHPQNYYHREQLLPHDSVNPTIWSKVFGASKRPIFTSVNAKNHLVTLSEVIAMYLLTWSPILWQQVALEPEKQLLLPEDWLTRYQQELSAINQFVEGLAQVQRVMAHIPVYMIFDDHDITDDWNLTRGWEEAAYTHPFSKRIIGNALAGYYLCQGWGNQAEKFSDIVAKHEQIFTECGIAAHDDFVDELLAFDQWHYQLNTTPKMLVLDTRTQRWRSESNPGKPSGLMDWESLTELQTQLINEPCVIMVSAAPIYGVKLIEAVQRVFTFFGNPLAVDAENWMAHKGTANVILNIFRNRKTPPQFIILSGDVHYSFVYDVSHRFIRSSSRIVQITCSGIKNEFPEKLIHILERLNYYLYGTYSPLNWFTKRRRMKIKVRKPSSDFNKTVYNGSGIGVMNLSDDFEHVEAKILNTKGQVVIFEQSEETT
ncbi:metallophosphoesterase family protein [Thalassotalea algicola]|uniref:alkaline phosphatase family protein n=1 Tax=Thalassotalea algicola TaxID=2716224 RepID=UPI002E28CC14|nr:alkaline phosphatase family protein [Thalassotalea algicola]